MSNSQTSALSPAPGPVSTQSGLGMRWMVCALLFFATTISYLDRQVLSILAPSLQKSMGWSETDYSNIVFAFQCAYALALPVAGRLVDRFGTKIGYALFVGLWSMASMSHSLARSALGFGFARVGLGLTESGNFPAAIKAVSEWFPKKERALATGIFNSGAMLGAIIAPAAVPILASKFGWRSTFLILGTLDITWLVVWLAVYRKPQEKKGLHPDELALIQSDAEEATTQPPPWKSLLGYRGVWAFVIGKFLSDPIWWFFLFWLPKFLGKQYGLNLSSLGLPLVVIYLISAFGSIGGGWGASFLIRRGWSLNKARKGIMLVCALMVVPVFFAAKTSSLWVAVLLIGMAAAAHCGWMANLFSLVSDIFPKNTIGAVIGIGSTAGSFGGMLIALFTGWLLQNTGTYWPLFAIASSSYLVAWTLVHLLVPRIERV